MAAKRKSSSKTDKPTPGDTADAKGRGGFKGAAAPFKGKGGKKK